MTPSINTKKIEELRKKLQGLSKVAFAPPGAPPMDPSMMGGMPPPPMDPAMMGGAPMDPAMAGGMPPMDPAMMGGMPPPPMDPAMMGGAPMDPAMMGGMPPPPMDPAMMGGMPPMDPAMMGGMPMEEDPIMVLTEMVNALGFMVGRIVKHLDIPMEDEGVPEGDAVAAQEEMLPPDMQQAVAEDAAVTDENKKVMTDQAEEAVGGASPGFLNNQISQFQE